MKIYKQLAGQTLIYGLGTMVPKVLNYLLLTPFYTRIFLTHEYGVITELYAYVAFLMVLLTYGMETTYFRFSVDSKKENIIFNSALTSLLFTTGLFLAFVFFNSTNISNLIGYENNVEYIRWFSLIVAFDVITAIPFARLRQQNKALRFSIIKIVNIITNVGFNIFFFIICKHSSIDWFANLYNPEIGVGYAFLSNLIASLVTFLLLLPEYFNFKFKFDFQIYLSMLKYAMPLLIVGLAGMVNEVGDKIFMKYLTNESLNSMEQVGLYGANYKLAILMTIFIQMFKYAAEPFFFSQSGKSDSKKIYANVMNYFIIFCLLIFLVVTLYINVFKHFIDSSYFDGLIIVPIVLLANLFLGVYYNLAVWYKVNDLTKFGAYFAIIGMVITVIGNFLFIPKYGYIASAWSTLICYFVMVMLSYIFGNIHYKVPYQTKRALFYFLTTMVLFVIKYFIDLNIVYDLLFATFLLSIFLIIVVKTEKISLSNLKSIISI